MLPRDRGPEACGCISNVNPDQTVRITGALVACIIAAGSAQTPSIEDPIYVGILEPQASDTPITDQLNRFHARVAFQFLKGALEAHATRGFQCGITGQSSETLPPAKLAWTVALDGKNVGAVNSVRPPSYTRYADVGIQELTPDSNPPAVRRGTAALQTWMGASNFRPLVIISRPNYRDPNHWKAMRLLPPLSKQARTEFARPSR